MRCHLVTPGVGLAALAAAFVGVMTLTLPAALFAQLPESRKPAAGKNPPPGLPRPGVHLQAQPDPRATPAVTAPTPSTAPLNSQQFEEFDVLIRYYLTRSFMPGAVLRIDRGGAHYETALGRLVHDSGAPGV
jgi:hypothetical protein